MWHDVNGEKEKNDQPIKKCEGEFNFQPLITTTKKESWHLN